MANIEIRKNGPQTSTRAATPQLTAWDPARFVSRMMGWDPFREMAPFLAEAPLGFEPAVDVKETKEGYVFKADVPGIGQGDLDISLTGNRLSISGRREAEKEDSGATYYTYERTRGSFTRSFTLPEGIDASAVRADLEGGVLSVMLPKKPEAQAKKIPIASSKS